MGLEELVGIKGSWTDIEIINGGSPEEGVYVDSKSHLVYVHKLQYRVIIKGKIYRIEIQCPKGESLLFKIHNINNNQWHVLESATATINKLIEISRSPYKNSKNGPFLLLLRNERVANILVENEHVVNAMKKNDIHYISTSPGYGPGMRVFPKNTSIDLTLDKKRKHISLDLNLEEEGGGEEEEDAHVTKVARLDMSETDSDVIRSMNRIVLLQSLVRGNRVHKKAKEQMERGDYQMENALKVINNNVERIKKENLAMRELVLYLQEELRKRNGEKQALEAQLSKQVEFVSRLRSLMDSCP